MLFHDRIKQRMIVRGPDCGCGGTCSMCAPILERMHFDHAWEIKQAAKHILPEPSKENEDSEK